MIKIEFSNSNELMNFIRLFRHLDDEQIKELTKDLDTSSAKLVEAEQKEKENLK